MLRQTNESKSEQGVSCIENIAFLLIEKINFTGFLRIFLFPFYVDCENKIEELNKKGGFWKETSL